MGDPFANDLIQLNDEAVPDDEDVEWYTDTSESAVLERQKGTIGSSKLLAEMGAVTIERDIADSVAAFHEWYDGNDRGTDEVVSYLAELKSTYAHADAEIIGAACDVLFNENLLAEMEDLAPILEPYLNGSSAEKVVLGSLERLIGEKHPDELLKFTAHLLKALYENDLVSDDVMIKWGKKKSSKYVRNATSVEVKQAGAQFLTWLEEAEDEYSSYEEDSVTKGEMVMGTTAELQETRPSLPVVLPRSQPQPPTTTMTTTLTLTTSDRTPFRRSSGCLPY